MEYETKMVKDVPQVIRSYSDIAKWIVTKMFWSCKSSNSFKRKKYKQK